MKLEGYEAMKLEGYAATKFLSIPAYWLSSFPATHLLIFLTAHPLSLYLLTFPASQLPGFSPSQLLSPPIHMNAVCFPASPAARS